MVEKARFGQLLIFSPLFSIVGIRIDADSAAWRKYSRYFDILRLHQSNQVFHDNIDTVLVKCAMIAKTEQIEFQTFALNHFHIRNIIDANGCKIGLPGNRAKTGEFGTVERYPIVVVLMFVDEGFKHFGSIIHLVFGFVSQVAQFFQMI
ncbi:MAG: hypothetical protein PWQ71_752 [Bacteroidota bacterium]|nr:hypothetical protein [Bacteroidota bacterium]